MVDYKGQALAERVLMLVFALICSPAWIYGYLQQDFTYPLYAWGVATVIAALAILPNWGFYNRNPIQWLPSIKYIKKKTKGKTE